MQKNELFHSDTYLGSDYSDGLQHWKYLKRYKKGGKWVYVYADKNTHHRIGYHRYEAASNANTLHDIETGSKALTNVKNNLQFYKYWYKKDPPEGFTKVYNPDSEHWDATIKTLNEAINNKSKYAISTNNEMRSHMYEADKLIGNNSVSTLSKKAVESGKNYIANLVKKKK